VLKLENVSHNLWRDLTLALKAGESAKILVSSNEIKNALWAMLMGLEAPRQGRIWLFGEALAELAEEARLALYQRVGAVPENGGLISNLKAWENILLPSAVHKGMSVGAAEKPVASLFRAFGYGDEAIELLMGRLPDGLGLVEKRLVAFARARLMEPDLMIYDAPFTGLNREATGLLLEQTQAYHEQKRGRATLYLLPDDATSTRVKTDHSLSIH
jgi:phospholipid/cholesterol/gamma-HCH transport system ATP-binding protein